MKWLGELLICIWIFQIWITQNLTDYFTIFFLAYFDLYKIRKKICQMKVVIFLEIFKHKIEYSLCLSVDFVLVIGSWKNIDSIPNDLSPRLIIQILTLLGKLERKISGHILWVMVKD